jgi:predicted transcriptional regulator YdeE
MKIWQSNLDRTYTTDFEVYDERAQNPANVVVDIFIGVASSNSATE